MELSSKIITVLKSDNIELLKKIIKSIPKSELLNIITNEIRSKSSYNIKILIELKILSDIFDNNELIKMLHMTSGSYFNIEYLKILLQYGVDVNSYSDYKETILINSCRVKNYDCIIEILKFNPDLFLKDSKNKDAFYYAEGYIELKNLLVYHNIKRDAQQNEDKIKKVEELNKDKIKKLEEFEELIKKQICENLELKKENSELKEIITMSHNNPQRPSPPTQEQWELINKSDNEQKPIEIEQKSNEIEQKSNEEKTIIVQETFQQKKQKAEEKYKQNQELKEKVFLDIYFTDILIYTNIFNGKPTVMKITDKIYCNMPNEIKTYLANLKEVGKLGAYIKYLVYMENNITYIKFLP